VTARDDWIGFGAIAIIAIGTVAFAHLAAGAKPQAASSASGPDTPCAEWTDGCVVCQRVAGEPMCSTPGIACVRGEVQCLRR
jgi:hypothetical protein